MNGRHLRSGVERRRGAGSRAGRRRSLAGIVLVAAVLGFASCATAPKYCAGTPAAPVARGAVSAADSIVAIPFVLRPPVDDWRCSRISSPFGRRGARSGAAARFHDGVDIRTDRGETIFAAADGTVRFSGRRNGYGTLVIIDHAGGVSTLYAHLSYITVRAARRISAGETIGRAGKRGRATGIHLHFELRRNGRAIDPAPHLCLDSALHSP